MIDYYNYKINIGYWDAARKNHGYIIPIWVSGMGIHGYGYGSVSQYP
jgi:hypothetical protein